MKIHLFQIKQNYLFRITVFMYRVPGKFTVVSQSLICIFFSCCSLQLGSTVFFPSFSFLRQACVLRLAGCYTFSDTGSQISIFLSTLESKISVGKDSFQKTSSFGNIFSQYSFDRWTVIISLSSIEIKTIKWLIILSSISSWPYIWAKYLWFF